MNEKNLKNKVYLLLFDKISKEDFTKDISILFEVYKAKENSLLHDLTLVNYDAINYKKLVVEVISKYTTKEELISLKIYQDCLNIIETTDQKVAFHYSRNLGEVFTNSDHQYEVVYDFYRFNDELSLIKDDLVKTKIEDVYYNIKKCARVVVEKYNNAQKQQQWTEFLHTPLGIFPRKKPLQAIQKQQII